MTSILCVGSAVLDLVFSVPRHPAEDEELRATALRIAPGGNAANTARVLRGLGHEVSLGAVLADHPAGSPLEEGLRRAGVDLAPCRRAPGMPPLSAILLSERDGRRAIVHHRATPEFGLEDFKPLDLARWGWLHLESRPNPATSLMVRHAGLARPGLPVSVEAEKVREGLEGCLSSTRAVFFSRGYAGARGFDRPEAFLAAMRERAPEALLTVTWGARGAWGIGVDGTVHHEPAHPPPAVVDTLGAGDTFNAGMIHALAAGASLKEALAEACGLAGRKVGRIGLEGLP